jgi:predicted nucleotidyltransferase
MFGLTKQTYEKIIALVNKYSKYQFILFGSRARGDYKTGSDIDIAVDGIIDDKDKFNITDDFDLLMIPYEIDLVFLQDVTKEKFLESIKREGIKINE